MEIKPLITLFFFFVLIAGIVIIYYEEIQKMEYFGRLQTTAVPRTVSQQSTTQPSYSGPQIDTTPRSFSQPNGINFGNGRIVDAQVKDIEKTSPGTVLHTISSGVTDYYAQGFLEEAEKLYKPSQ